MTSTHHKPVRFSVGDFSCAALADGQHKYENPAGLLFSNAPAEELRKALSLEGTPSEQWTSWTSDYTCLLVDTGKQRVLMDSGSGALLPEAGRLTASLQALDLSPADIDLVCFSHAHPDHIGFAGFPNARLIMNRKEWQFWHTQPELPRLPQAMRDALLQLILPALAHLQNRLELIDDVMEIAPGIQTLAAPGHTPGHLAVAVASGNQTLLYTGDAFLHPLHLRHPQWSALVDVLPEQAVATRKRLLQLARQGHAPIFGFHFPFPSQIAILREA